MTSDLAEIIDRIKWHIVDQFDDMDGEQVYTYSDPVNEKEINYVLTKLGEIAVVVAPSDNTITTETRMNRRLRVTYNIDIFMFMRILSRKANAESMPLHDRADAIFKLLMFNDLRKDEDLAFLRQRTPGNTSRFQTISDTTSMIQTFSMLFSGEKDTFL